MKRIVLAYTGGLETSVAIPWLRDCFSTDPESGNASVEVIAVIVDLGRRSELVELRERALSLGAVRCHVVDVREPLVRHYILPALQAGAFSEAASPMTSAIARPLVAKTLVDVARMEGAGAIAYGDDSGEDRASMDVLTRTLNPALEIAPARIWGMSDAAAAAYARARGIQVHTPSGRENMTANLWGRSLLLDSLEDSWADVPEDAYTLTRPAGEAPGEPAYVEIELEAGIPVRVNGIEMPLVEMIESLETIAGAHGVGRVDTIVSAQDGTKVREIGEAPAAVLLQLAQRELQSLVVDAELARRMGEAGRAYAELIHRGRWFCQTRGALDAFVAAVMPGLGGSVRLRLFKGDCRVAGRRASAVPQRPSPVPSLVKAQS